ncbi:MAG: GNAT family N-acetyltransferase [Acidimicrobiales bacterium]
MAVHLRPAVPGDAEPIEQVRVAGWRTAYRGIVSDAFLDAMAGDVERRRRHLTERVEDVIEIVAVDEDELVGWVVAGPSRDEHQETPMPGEVYGCYVAPSRWRIGLGRQLLEHAVEGLRGRGHREVTLWVLEGNQRARRFYEAMGFEPDGTVQELDLGGPVLEVRYRHAVRAAVSSPGQEQASVHH